MMLIMKMIMIMIMTTIQVCGEKMITVIGDHIR